ncbi:MAG: beta-ketoacyl-[acyl-carrier-protein] synthase family protein [Bdellovibrionota bacterium]
MRTSVWITGTGVVSCVGNTPKELWNATLEGRSGIRDGLGRVDLDARPGKSRGTTFAIEAATQAMKEAGWKSIGEGDGVILGTTTGNIDLWDKDLVQFLSNADENNRQILTRSFAQQSLGAMLDSLIAEIGRPTKMALLSSACSAATQAIALATMWLEQGLVKRVLVGGSEVLSSLTVEGFKSLQLLSMEPCLPFDSGRRGINLSEGAGFLTLETSETSAVKKARVSGYGLATDSFHMTGPHPEGLGSYKALQAALQTSGLSTKEVSWVHAHGTGSELNDFSEGQAIAKLFGDVEVPVSSTKNTHGHALGASGAIESILCVEAIMHQRLLKTGGLKNPDSKIAIRHVSSSEPSRVDHILKSTLGFGGINAGLVLSRADVGR